MPHAGPLRLLRKQISAFADAAERIHDDDVEALHRTRVASRRLRELLPVLGLDGDATRELARRIKKVTRQLGALRELDVLSVTIRELGNDARYSRTALQRMDAAVDKARLAARERLAAGLPPARLERLARRLERAAEHLERDAEGAVRYDTRQTKAWVWALEARIARRGAELRAALEAAGSVYLPERLHDVRIAGKKLRYALELAGDARPQRAAAREIIALQKIQDILGRLHDLEVLIEHCRQAQASLIPPVITVWRHLGALVHALEEDCRALHARYVRQRTTLAEIVIRLSGQKVQPAVTRTSAMITSAPRSI